MWNNKLPFKFENKKKKKRCQLKRYIFIYIIKNIMILINTISICWIHQEDSIRRLWFLWFKKKCP